MVKDAKDIARLNDAVAMLTGVIASIEDGTLNINEMYDRLWEVRGEIIKARDGARTISRAEHEILEKEGRPISFTHENVSGVKTERADSLTQWELDNIEVVRCSINGEGGWTIYY